MTHFKDESEERFNKQEKDKNELLDYIEENMKQIEKLTQELELEQDKTIEAITEKELANKQMKEFNL